VGRACSTNGEKRNEYRILLGKPDGMAQDMDQWRALVNTVMNLRVPLNAGKFLSTCIIGGFSRRVQLHKGSRKPFQVPHKSRSLTDVSDLLLTYCLVRNT
jgi:hypothetical protein